MPYGTIKIDTITFTDAGVDKSIAVSGLVQNPTFSGNVTVTGTVSGTTVRATTVSGVTVSGTTANFASGVYTTQISGAIVKVPVGTAGAPTVQVGTGASIAPGLYSPATDQLGISTGGSFRLVVDSTGRVGIGTSSPGAILHTTATSAGAATVGAYLQNSSLTAGTEVRLAFGPNTNLVSDNRYSWIGALNLAGSNDSALTFATAPGGAPGVERMRIDSSGRVGIGTSSPSGGLQLANPTAGSAADFVISNPANNWSIKTGTTTNALTIVDNQYTAERFRIDSIGNVGIGTSSPSSKLEISSSSGSGSSYSAIKLNNTSLGGARINFGNSSVVDLGSLGLITEDVGSGTFNDGVLVFNTAEDGTSNEKMRISSRGFVGIGATSPLTKLDVRNGVITAGSTSSTGGSEILRGFYSDTQGALAVIGSEYSSGGLVMGAGVKPSTSAPDAFLSSTSIAIARGAYTIASNVHKWYIGATQTVAENSSVSTSEVMRIDSSGRVGIGTTNLADRLAVNGSIATTVGSGGELKLYETDTTRANHLKAGADASGAYIDSTYSTGGSGALIFRTISNERLRIDSNGRLLVGTSSARGNFKIGIALYDAAQQLEAGSQGFQSFVGGSPSAAGPYLMLAHQRSGTVGGNTVLVSGDEMGTISFHGGDGTNLVIGAAIKGEVDGTPGANDMPGRLIFSTTADGASSPTERMRIESNGNTRFSNLTVLYPATDNAVSNGGSGFRWSQIWAANGTIQTSDERAKTEITNAVIGFNFIKALRPVSYKWIEGGKRDTGERDEDGNCIYESLPGERTHWGFIAQEVKEAVDATGIDFGGWVLTDKDDPDSQQALRYDQFIAPLTKALQEAIAKIETLEAKVAALEEM